MAAQQDKRELKEVTSLQEMQSGGLKTSGGDEGNNRGDGEGVTWAE